MNSLKWQRVELLELVQPAMPLIKEFLEVNKVHSNLFYEILLVLFLIALYLRFSDLRILAHQFRNEALMLCKLVP